MIHDFPEWWAFITYDGFKYNIDVTRGIIVFAEERIKVGKEEAGKINFNQSYDKLEAKQDNKVTRHIP